MLAPLRKSNLRENPFEIHAIEASRPPGMNFDISMFIRNREK
jgi:hypothetical protein